MEADGGLQHDEHHTQETTVQTASQLYPYQLCGFDPVLLCVESGVKKENVCNSQSYKAVMSLSKLLNKCQQSKRYTWFKTGGGGGPAEGEELSS